jgi:hypothetical protein
MKKNLSLITILTLVISLIAVITNLFLNIANSFFFSIFFLIVFWPIIYIVNYFFHNHKAVVETYTFFFTFLNVLIFLATIIFIFHSFEFLQKQMYFNIEKYFCFKIFLFCLPCILFCSYIFCTYAISQVHHKKLLFYIICVTIFLSISIGVFVFFINLQQKNAIQLTDQFDQSYLSYLTHWALFFIKAQLIFSISFFTYFFLYCLVYIYIKHYRTTITSTRIRILSTILWTSCIFTMIFSLFVIVWLTTNDVPYY